MTTNRPPSCDLPPDHYQPKLKPCPSCGAAAEMSSGQWLPAPSPDELATLRAKAEAYDKGQTTNGVFSETTGKIVCVISTPTKDLAPGYTCRKVRVCEVVG